MMEFPYILPYPMGGTDGDPELRSKKIEFEKTGLMDKLEFWANEAYGRWLIFKSLVKEVKERIEKEEIMKPIELEKMSYTEARKKARCPYRQDLGILCLEDCGKGNAVDCPIWLQESGQIAYALSQQE